MSNQQQQQSQQQQPKLIRAVVARGRSIDVPVSGNKVLAGYGKDDGKPVYRIPTRHHRAGDTIELPADEVKTLRAAGYLVDPDNVPPPAAEGPSFSSDTPGQVRPA